MYTHGKPFRYSARSWMRRDTFHTGETDTLWCAGPQDDSPIVTSRDYDAACSLCWLHQRHTHDLHHARKETAVCQTR